MTNNYKKAERTSMKKKMETMMKKGQKICPKERKTIKKRGPQISIKSDKISDALCVILTCCACFNLR
jgi:hypothetical protein